MAETTKFEEWALVELFGHQKIVGKVSEASIAGGAFLRVDVPEVDGQASFTRFFGPSAIYSISPTTEAIARTMLADCRPEPINRWNFPALAEKIEAAQPSAEVTQETESMF